MSALATVQAPVSWGSAIELGNGLWKKRVLPVGSISYQGRQLHFTPEYLRGLEKAFRNGAYDYVPFQLADEKNNHTNAPERFRGTVVDMVTEPDGLYVLVEPTESGEEILRENPNLGVSCRIVEQYQRADGQFYPAAVQHILGTHDPRITSLGSWAPVDMANDGGLVIDLSGSSFGDVPPDAADLTDEELADLIEVMSEAEEEDAGGDGDLSDEELAALLAEVDGMSDADLAGLEEQAGLDEELEGLADDFEAEFGRLAATAQDRARADAAEAELAAQRAAHGHVERTEDVLARSLARLADGTHPDQEFASPRANAIELAARSIAGSCGPVDAVSGLCMNMGHQPGCQGYAGAVGSGVELAGSGLYDDVTGRFALELSNVPRQPSQLLPASTVELARAVHAVTPDLAGAGAEPSWDDLLGPSYGGDAYGDLAREIGHGELADPQPGYTGYPDVSGIRGALGL